MTIIALLSALIGALLAVRWSVFLLVPIIGVALPLVALIGIAQGESAGSLAVDMLITVTGLEAGYAAGLVMSVLADATRIAVMTVIKIGTAVVRPQ